jgi:hypothetical protein
MTYATVFGQILKSLGAPINSESERSACPMLHNISSALAVKMDAQPIIKPAAAHAKRPSWENFLIR